MPTAAVLGVTSIVGAVSARNASKRAGSAQVKAAETASAQTQKSADQARRDLFNIFPQAQQTAQQGFQGALDVFGQSLPAQTDTFQQGNVGAQQAILSGLPQMRNALFGNNVDFSQMQPFEVQQPDLSFFNQTLPQVQQRQERDAQIEQAIANGTSFYGNNNQGQQGQFQGASNIFNQNINPNGAGFSGANLLSGRFNKIR